MKRTEIAEILRQPEVGAEVKVSGWVRSFRSNRFIALYDGSSFNTLQVVVDFEKFDEEFLKKIQFHACISVTGKLVESQGAGQAVELMADSMELLGECIPDDYHLQPKNMTMEYLREKAHFRMRTQTFSAVFRIRHAVAYAVHKYFNDRGYYYMHTPIVTGSDAEGAGEMFRVTTLDIENPPLVNPLLKDLADDFYNEIKRAINESENLSLEGINNEIKLHLEDFTLEKIVKATPGQIKSIANNKTAGKLNSLFRIIYKEIKDKIFHIENIEIKPRADKEIIDAIRRNPAFKESPIVSPKPYLKKELSEILEKREKIPLQYQEGYPREKYDVLSLSFYNIKAVSRYNRLSTKSTLDFSTDFFGKSTNLTVSGQLQGEIAALALGKIYTFGPTFRAEQSFTTRHLAEFWMIEPEVAFNDIFDNMDLAEDFVKFLVRHILDNYPDDLAFLDKRIKDEEKNMKQEDRRPMGLVDMLRFVVDNDFERITYTEAVDILRNSNTYKKGKFKFDVQWGKDLQSEHERYLVEKHFQKPVFVRDYPKSIKAFYMRENDGTEPGKETVAAMDCLFPYIGEVIGGSQREERHGKLLERIHAQGIHEEELWWYLELRKFGGCPHAGFGLGFERMVQFITGMGNIRDVIAFPRAAGQAEF